MQTLAQIVSPSYVAAETKPETAASRNSDSQFPFNSLKVPGF
jgi:hypothetical protein